MKFTKSGLSEDIAMGRSLIASGRVGCIVLAGGDGSRLGWSGPKGTFPLSLVRQKNLFDLLSERVEAASSHFGRDLPLAIMTSPLNEEVTQKALAHHKGSLDFFSQKMVPLLDTEKNPLAEERPDGNGEVFHRFHDSGLLEKWKRMGVEYMQVVLIDNPLAEPFDPNLCGAHFKARADVTIKAVEKKSDEEKVGVIGVREGKHCVVEYSENPPKEWRLANISLFCFSLSFAEKVHKIQLPIHMVRKHVNSQPVYKRETFIFDLLPFADSTEVIVYPREETFAPLKTRDDVGPVQRALLDRDKRAFTALTGQQPKEAIFELHSTFHFPSDELKKRWSGKSLPDTPFVQP